MTALPEGANAEQEEYWNSAPGRKWIDFEETLDALLRPVTAVELARADPRPGECAMDVGCGTGAMTQEIAARVGPEGRVLAVDISEPLLERARARTHGLPQVETLRADAQVHRFEPESVDLVVSRFGVMFFDDPVAAFRNLLGALRSGGRMCFVAWAPVAENPWFEIPRSAAIDRLGEPLPQPPDAPGPLAFADRDRVRGILRSAGCDGVEAEAEHLDLVYGGGIEALAELAANVGPAARIMKERGGGPADLVALREDVLGALGRFRCAGEVRVPATLNFFRAHRL